jgi:hypothetical protein
MRFGTIVEVCALMLAYTEREIASVTLWRDAYSLTEAIMKPLWTMFLYNFFRNIKLILF